ncbi:VOC family protein [Periweissella beninensis]|uniref:VOC family protein n=1 Tax=Periweissella beninensis TaxID=504936 RepID=UPI0021A69F60|nr:hypothetical protein [Periweissella beninensis]MCT4396723.1 hypothetical protein [Periweissella beninensis]
MKPKKISSHIIPVKNQARAFRFYHEVFDIQIVSTPSLLKQLVLEQAPLEFIDAKPTTLKIHVKDHADSVQNHLTSYFVPLLETPITSKNKVSFKVHDSEENILEIVANV